MFHFSSILTKGDYFHDFLLTSLDNPFQKGEHYSLLHPYYTQNSQNSILHNSALGAIGPRVDSYWEGRQNWNLQSCFPWPYFFLYPLSKILDACLSVFLDFFTLKGPLRQYFPKRGRKRRERIDESKNVLTTLTRTCCKCSRPLPYCNPNCRTPQHWKFTQYHRTTQPPPCSIRIVF